MSAPISYFLNVTYIVPYLDNNTRKKLKKKGLLSACKQRTYKVFLQNPINPLKTIT